MPGQWNFGNSLPYCACKAVSHCVYTRQQRGGAATLCDEHCPCEQCIMAGRAHWVREPAVPCIRRLF